MKLSKFSIFGVLILMVSIITSTFPLPSAPGRGYEIFHYYNLFLPSFGNNMKITPIPQAYKTLTTHYILKKILLEIVTDNDVLLLHRLINDLDPAKNPFKVILIFLSYVLFFRTLKIKTDQSIFSASILAISNVSVGIPLILGMTAFYGFLEGINRKKLLIGAISFVTLTLYWHSAHVLFLVMITAALIFKIARTPSYKQYYSILTWILIVISTFVWLWHRNRIPIEVSSITWQYIKLGLFSKGKFAPKAYVYSWNKNLSTLGTILDLCRYISYLIIMLLLLITAIFTSKKGEENEFTLPFIFGNLFYSFLYFIATKTFAVAGFIWILYPYIISVYLVKKKIINKKLFFYIMILIIFVSGTFIAQGFYQQILDYSHPEFSQNFELFGPPVFWLCSSSKEANLIADSSTIGYIALWYGKEKLYKYCKFHFASIGTTTYEALLKRTYVGREIFIYNFEIYKENLIFESLEAWDIFKPLPPEIVINSDFNIVFNSQALWICAERIGGEKNESFGNWS